MSSLQSPSDASARNDLVYGLDDRPSAPIALLAALPAIGAGKRDRVLEQLAELLENGAAAGAWPLRNPRLNALLLYSGLHGAADDAIAGGRLDTQPLAGELADAFLRLLGASD